MPSTDIDGSPIVILTEEEALYIYNHLVTISSIHFSSPLNLQIIHKIIRDLKLGQPEEPSEEPSEEQPNDI